MFRSNSKSHRSGFIEGDSRGRPCWLTPAMAASRAMSCAMERRDEAVGLNVLAHGEGRAQFAHEAQRDALESAGQVAMRFIDNDLQTATTYPANPNGSPAGITGLCNADGRVTIMMPHPERVYRAAQLSWCPPDWQTDSGWMRLFRNARVWLG